MKNNKEIHYSKVLEGQQVFSTFDSMNILELKQSRFVQWMRDGYIPKGSKVVWGSRTKTVFTLIDLYKIKLFQKLVEWGIERKVAGEISKNLNWENFTSKEYPYLIVPKGKINFPPIQAKEINSLEGLKSCDEAVFINVTRLIENIQLRA